MRYSRHSSALHPSRFLYDDNESIHSMISSENRPSSNAPRCNPDGMSFGPAIHPLPPSYHTCGFHSMASGMIGCGVLWGWAQSLLVHFVFGWFAAVTCYAWLVSISLLWLLVRFGRHFEGVESAGDGMNYPAWLICLVPLFLWHNEAFVLRVTLQLITSGSMCWRFTW